MSRRLDALPARPLRESEIEALGDAEAVDAVAVGSYWYDGSSEGAEMLALSLVMVMAERWSAIEFDGDGWAVVARGERGGVEADETAQAALRELEDAGPG